MAEPRTIRVGISGTSAVESYTLAAGLAQFVESVYVEVDNSAGADAQPLVTLSDQSGVVIAKKRQGDALDAGTAGSATWALRLTDETTRASLALETGKATWTPAEVHAGAAKTILPGRPGTIIYPADFLMTVTVNFNPHWTAVAPQLQLEDTAASVSWWSFDISGGGSGGRWASWSSMIGEDNFTPWTDTLTGKGLRATVLPNDLTTLTTGTLAAFVTARRIVWTA